jgi:hypothetical protein
MTKVKTESAENAGTKMTDIQAEIAARLKVQKEVREQLAGDSNFISFKAGHLSIDGTPVPSGEIDVVVLDITFERTYYDKPYDGATAQAPACYSYDGESPHEEASTPQSVNCAECARNAWGSGKEGRGKACREGARLGLISADADPEKAKIYIAKVPVSSLKTVKDYLAYCQSRGKLVGQAEARLVLRLHPKSIFAVTLTPTKDSGIDDKTLLKRTRDAEQITRLPYPILDKAPQTSGKY